MTKPLVEMPDVENVVVDWLIDALAEQDETVTVGVTVPDQWTRPDLRADDEAPHVLVAVDDSEIIQPIMVDALVRVSVFADRTSEAKRLALLVLALLLTNRIGSVSPESGPVAGRDPDSHAELATFTTRARVRPTQLSPS